MPLGETFESKTLKSGATVRVETLPRPDGTKEEHFQCTIADETGSLSFPANLRDCTREKARAIFDDIRTDDTWETVFRRREQYMK